MIQVSRAKRCDTREWIVGFHVKDKHDYILENLDMRVRGVAELINAHIVSSATISISTRHHDKNGIEIFENDIIEWIGNVKYIVKYGDYAGQVGLGYYYGLGFYLERVGFPEHRVPFNAVFLHEYTVIGNVFDNTNLLVSEG